MQCNFQTRAIGQSQLLFYDDIVLVVDLLLFDDTKDMSATRQLDHLGRPQPCDKALR